MNIVTTSAADAAGTDILRRVLEEAYDIGKEGGERSDLPNEEDLWRELLGLVGIMV